MEERLQGSRFEFRPISLESLTLSNCDHHFLNNTVKIQLVIDCIKQNMNEFILFTDATIYQQQYK